MYELTELARRIAGPHAMPRWYREERSLYTDNNFVWLFDQVCLEARRLRVRGVVIDNAHRLEPKTMRVLMRLRARLNNRIALIFVAQLTNKGWSTTSRLSVRHCGRVLRETGTTLIVGQALQPAAGASRE
jgi:hypothetical protein